MFQEQNKDQYFAYSVNSATEVGNNHKFLPQPPGFSCQTDHSVPLTANSIPNAK